MANIDMLNNLQKYIISIADKTIDSGKYDTVVAGSIVSSGPGYYNVQLDNGIGTVKALPMTRSITFNKDDYVYLVIGTAKSGASTIKSYYIFGKVENTIEDYYNLTDWERFTVGLGTSFKSSLLQNMPTINNSVLLSGFPNNKSVFIEELKDKGAFVISANFTVHPSYIERYGITNYGIRVQIGGDIYNLDKHYFTGTPLRGAVAAPQRRVVYLDREISANNIEVSLFTEIDSSRVNENIELEGSFGVSNIELQAGSLFDLDGALDIKITAKNGKNFFNQLWNRREGARDTIILEADVSYLGQPIVADTVQYYWIVRDPSITKTHPRYLYFVGEGWRCLNSYEEEDVILENGSVYSIQRFNNANNNIILTEEIGGFRFKEFSTNIRCVVRFETIKSTSNDFEILNYNVADFSVILKSDHEPALILDTDDKININTTVVNNTTGVIFKDCSYTYRWYYKIAELDDDGQEIYKEWENEPSFPANKVFYERRELEKVENLENLETVYDYFLTSDSTPNEEKKYWTKEYTNWEVLVPFGNDGGWHTGKAVTIQDKDLENTEIEAKFEDGNENILTEMHTNELQIACDVIVYIKTWINIVDENDETITKEILMPIEETPLSNIINIISKAAEETILKQSTYYKYYISSNPYVDFTKQLVDMKWNGDWNINDKENNIGTEWIGSPTLCDWDKNFNVPSRYLFISNEDFNSQEIHYEKAYYSYDGETDILVYIPTLDKSPVEDKEYFIKEDNRDDIKNFYYQNQRAYDYISDKGNNLSNNQYLYMTQKTVTYEEKAGVTYLLNEEYWSEPRLYFGKTQNGNQISDRALEKIHVFDQLTEGGAEQGIYLQDVYYKTLDKERDLNKTYYIKNTDNGQFEVAEFADENSNFNEYIDYYELYENKLYINAEFINTGALRIVDENGNQKFYADIDQNKVEIGGFSVDTSSISSEQKRYILQENLSNFEENVKYYENQEGKYIPTTDTTPISNKKYYIEKYWNLYFGANGLQIGDILDIWNDGKGTYRASFKGSVTISESDKQDIANKIIIDAEVHTLQIVYSNSTTIPVNKPSLEYDNDGNQGTNIGEDSTWHRELKDDDIWMCQRVAPENGSEEEYPWGAILQIRGTSPFVLDVDNDYVTMSKTLQGETGAETLKWTAEEVNITLYEGVTPISDLGKFKFNEEIETGIVVLYNSDLITIEQLKNTDGKTPKPTLSINEFKGFKNDKVNITIKYYRNREVKATSSITVVSLDDEMGRLSVVGTSILKRTGSSYDPDKLTFTIKSEQDNINFDKYEYKIQIYKDNDFFTGLLKEGKFSKDSTTALYTYNYTLGNSEIEQCLNIRVFARRADSSYSWTLIDKITVNVIEDGQSITYIEEYYLLNNSASTPEKGVGDWRINPSSIPSPTSDNQYLWNYEKSYFNKSDTTTPIAQTEVVLLAQYLKGDDGNDGRGIKTISERYLLTSNNTVPSPSGYSMSLISQNYFNNNPNKTYYTRKDNRYQITHKYINDNTYLYSNWSTSTSLSTSSYLPYKWNYEQITYTDNSTSTTNSQLVAEHSKIFCAAYSNSSTIPDLPTYNINNYGHEWGIDSEKSVWHSVMTKDDIWMISKTDYASTSSGAWEGPVKIKGEDGQEGAPGEAYSLVVAPDNIVVGTDSEGNIPADIEKWIIQVTPKSNMKDLVIRGVENKSNISNKELNGIYITYTYSSKSGLDCSLERDKNGYIIYPIDFEIEPITKDDTASLNLYLERYSATTFPIQQLAAATVNIVKQKAGAEGIGATFTLVPNTQTVQLEWLAGENNSDILNYDYDKISWKLYKTIESETADITKDYKYKVFIDGNSNSSNNFSDTENPSIDLKNGKPKKTIRIEAYTNSEDSVSPFIVETINILTDGKEISRTDYYCASKSTSEPPALPYLSWDSNSGEYVWMNIYSDSKAPSGSNEGQWMKYGTFFGGKLKSKEDTTKDYYPWNEPEETNSNPHVWKITLYEYEGGKPKRSDPIILSDLDAFSYAAESQINDENDNTGDIGTGEAYKYKSKIGKWCAIMGKTIIDGGMIVTGSIQADQIAANTITANELSTEAIKSNGFKYTKTNDKDDTTTYSEAGTFIDLNTGYIYSPGLVLYENNGVYVLKIKGEIQAGSIISPKARIEIENSEDPLTIQDVANNANEANNNANEAKNKADILENDVNTISNNVDTISSQVTEANSNANAAKDKANTLEGNVEMISSNVEMANNNANEAKNKANTLEGLYGSGEGLFFLNTAAIKNIFISIKSLSSSLTALPRWINFRIGSPYIDNVTNQEEECDYSWKDFLFGKNSGSNNMIDTTKLPDNIGLITLNDDDDYTLICNIGHLKYSNINNSNDNSGTVDYTYPLKNGKALIPISLVGSSDDIKFKYFLWKLGYIFNFSIKSKNTNITYNIERVAFNLYWGENRDSSLTTSNLAQLLRYSDSTGESGIPSNPVTINNVQIGDTPCKSICGYWNLANIDKLPENFNNFSNFNVTAIKSKNQDS